MRIRTATGAVVGAVALAATSLVPASAGTDDVNVSIHKSDGVNGVQVADAIDDLQHENRGDFVQKSVQAAFDADGGDHSVVMMNLSQGHEANLGGDVRLYANVEYDGVYYGLWITDGGEFTNTGDGGYINWAFQGWYERDGNHLTFRQP